MRYLYTYLFLALTFAAAAGAQIVLDPSPARVDGHPPTTPAEQLLVTNFNPNFGVNGGMYFPEGVAVDTSGSSPILYVADTGNNRILAWKNATSSTLTNLQAPDLIIGQPNSYTTLPATNGGLSFPTGLVVDAKGQLICGRFGEQSHSALPDAIHQQRDSVRFGVPCRQQAGYRAGPARYVHFQIGEPGRQRLGGDALSCLWGATLTSPRWPLMQPAICSFAMPVTAACCSIQPASLTSGAADPAASVVIGQAGFTVVNTSGQCDGSQHSVHTRRRGLRFRRDTFSFPIPAATA